MIITKIKRTLRSGFISFWRNGYVSLASVLVMTVTLLVMSAMFLVGATLNSTLETIKDKVDISVYFKKDAVDADIAILQKRIEGLAEVAEVELTTREEAYDNFRTRHQDNQSTIEALEEVGTNPFGASINIKAKNPNQYESIVAFVEHEQEASRGDSIIDRINYANNKQAIEALSRIIQASNTIGTALIIFFAFVAILITFNTVRLAIYVFREEIAVMRLVGASEMYIKGPFVTVGLIYGVVSSLVTLLILYPVTYYAGPVTQSLGTGMNLWSYYLEHFLYMSLIVIGVGLVLGAISSYLAVRKYLKV
jgi:cell division transport system permease protein